MKTTTKVLQAVVAVAGVTVLEKSAHKVNDLVKEKNIQKRVDEMVNETNLVEADLSELSAARWDIEEEEDARHFTRTLIIAGCMLVVGSVVGTKIRKSWTE